MLDLENLRMFNEEFVRILRMELKSVENPVIKDVYLTLCQEIIYFIPELQLGSSFDGKPMYLVWTNEKRDNLIIDYDNPIYIKKRWIQPINYAIYFYLEDLGKKINQKQL